MRKCECGIMSNAIPCLDCVAATPRARRRQAPKDWDAIRSPSSRHSRTPGWARSRERALTRARHRCQNCHRATELEVHHITPVAVMLEQYGANNTHELRARGVDVDNPDNLAVLCRTCHDRTHER